MVKIAVEGLSELDFALTELPKATARSVLRRVLSAAAEPILQAAKSRAKARPANAPAKYYGKGENKKLRRPGTDEFLVQSGTQLTKNQARQARKEGKNSAEHYVGSRDPIARLLEYGTAEMPAHPIFRPAWDGHKHEALAIIQEDLGTEIEKSRQRLAKKAARIAAKNTGA